MTDLARLLKEAGDGSQARFTSTDIGRRVRLRRKRRTAIRVLTTMSAVVVAIGIITTITSDPQDTHVVTSPQSSTTTEPPDDGSSPVKLVGNDWSLLKASGVSALGDRRVRLSFASDGTLTLDAGCGQMKGMWQVRAAKLTAKLQDTPTESCDSSTSELQQLVISRLSGPIVIGDIRGYADTLQLGPTEEFLAFQRVSSSSPRLLSEMNGEAKPGSTVTIAVRYLDEYRGEELGVTMQTIDGFAYVGVSEVKVDKMGEAVLTLSPVPSALVHEGPCRDTTPCDVVDVTDGYYSLVLTSNTRINAAGQVKVVGVAEFLVGTEASDNRQAARHVAAPGMKEVVYKGVGIDIPIDWNVFETDKLPPSERYCKDEAPGNLYLGDFSGDIPNVNDPTSDGMDTCNPANFDHPSVFMSTLWQVDRIASSPREPLVGITGYRVTEEIDRISIDLPNQGVSVGISPRGELTDRIIRSLHKGPPKRIGGG